MSAGEAFIATIPIKTEFYDRHERRAYARALETAKRIIDNPDAITQARRFLERHFRSDPHQRLPYRVWAALLDLPREEEIARALLEDSNAGAELRGSAPVFVVLAGEQRLEMLR